MTTNLHPAARTDTTVGELLLAQVLPDARRVALSNAIAWRSEAAIACLRIDPDVTAIFKLLQAAQRAERVAACLLQWLDHPSLIDAWAAFARLDPSAEIHQRGWAVCELHLAAGYAAEHVPLVETGIAALRALGLSVHDGWAGS